MSEGRRCKHKGFLNTSITRIGSRLKYERKKLKKEKKKMRFSRERGDRITEYHKGMLSNPNPIVYPFFCGNDKDLCIGAAGFHPQPRLVCTIPSQSTHQPSLSQHLIRLSAASIGGGPSSTVHRHPPAIHGCGISFVLDRVRGRDLDCGRHFTWDYQCGVASKIKPSPRVPDLRNLGLHVGDGLALRLLAFLGLFSSTGAGTIE